MPSITRAEILAPLIVAVDHPALRDRLEIELPGLGVTPAIVGPSYAVFRVPPQQVDEGIVVLDTNDDVARLVQIVNDLYRSPLHLHGASGTICVVSNKTFDANESLGWWLIDRHAAVFSVRLREELSAEEIARVIRWASRSGPEEDEGPGGTNHPLSFEALFDSIRSDPANAEAWMAAYDRVMSQDGIHHARYAIGAAFCW